METGAHMCASCINSFRPLKGGNSTCVAASSYESDIANTHNTHTWGLLSNAGVNSTESCTTGV